jgi:hypothetical protein
MAIEAIGALAAQAAGTSGASAPGIRSVDLGSVANPPSALTSQTHSQLEVRFREAMDRSHAVSGASQTGSVSPAMKGMFTALDRINVDAKSVSDYATQAEASGGKLTPGEMIQLTMKCQEFMFQAQLTSNIANRSSDGVQQLFRQQG